jgi:hypothetical protein
MRPSRSRPSVLPAAGLEPPAEVRRRGTGGPIPAHLGGVKEPEPGQQVHPTRADRGFSPTHAAALRYQARQPSRPLQTIMRC